MTWSGHTGLFGDLPASLRGAVRARPGQVRGPSVAPLAATDGQERIGELLSDAVNLLLKAGLQLSSVRCRLEETDEQQMVERATSQIDAALVEIRHLGVRVLLAAQPHEQSSDSTQHLWP